MSAETTQSDDAIDWDTVERLYRAGIESLRNIGAKCGLTEGAIRKRAKRDGWVRDLAARIRARAEDLVRKAEVRKKSTQQLSFADENEVIESNAVISANVIRSQRQDVRLLREVVNALMEQIKCVVTSRELFAQVGEICSQGASGHDKALELYNKVIGLPNQTDTTKKLAETLKILIELERKIHKLDDGADDPLEAAARGAAEGATRGMSEFGKSALKALQDDLRNGAAVA